jgi:hypothetical protein
MRPKDVAAVGCFVRDHHSMQTERNQVGVMWASHSSRFLSKLSSPLPVQPKAHIKTLLANPMARSAQVSNNPAGRNLVPNHLCIEGAL